MNEGTKRGQKLNGSGAPSPMGSTSFRGTQGTGSSTNTMKNVMGSGKGGPGMARGVQGKG